MRRPALFHRETITTELHKEFAAADFDQAGFEQLLVAPDVELRAEVLGVGEADHRVGEGATVTAHFNFGQVCEFHTLGFHFLLKGDHDLSCVNAAHPSRRPLSFIAATRLPHVGQVDHAVIHLDDVAFVGSEFGGLHVTGWAKVPP